MFLPQQISQREQHGPRIAMHPMVEIHKRVTEVPTLIGCHKIAVLTSAKELLQPLTDNGVTQIKHEIGLIFRLFPHPTQHLIEMTGTDETTE